MTRSKTTRHRCCRRAMRAGARRLGAAWPQDDHHRLRHPRAGQSVRPADRRRRPGGRQRSRRHARRRAAGRRRAGRPAQAGAELRQLRRPGRRHLGARRSRWPRASTTSSPAACRSCSSTCSSTAVNAPYVGEKSVESGRILGKMVVDKLGGAVGQGHGHHRQLLPRLPGAREPRQGRRGIAEGRAGPQGPRPVRRQGQRGRQLQPLGAALRRQSRRRGADRPLRAGRRQPRQAQCRQRRQVRRRRLRPDRADNLKAIKDGHAYVTLGQSAFVQGYLPVALLVNAIKSKKPLGAGFYNAGTQVVTADSVDMGNGLPPIDLRRSAEAGGRSGGDRRLLQAVDRRR